MKRTGKIGVALLLLSLLAGVFFATTSAEEGQTVLFSVTTPSGEKTEYYDEKQLSEAASTAPSGSTVVILADIGSYDAILVEGGKVLYIDLNGKTIINKNHTPDDTTKDGQQMNKTCFAEAEGGELHIYSSKPGAAYFARNQKNQNPFVRTGGTEETAAYIGAFPTSDGVTVYPGDNISVFGCSAFNALGSSSIYVDGGYYYRNHSDYSGLLMARNSSFIRLKGAKLHASYDASVFSFQSGTNSRIECDGCIVVGPAPDSAILPPGEFKGADCVLTLKNTVVCDGTLSVGTGAGKIVVGEGCTFDTISEKDIGSGSVRIPEGYSYAKTNDFVTVNWRMNDYYGNPSAPFGLFDKTTTYTPRYAFAEAEDIATVTWRIGGTQDERLNEATGEYETFFVGGKVSTERWILGTTPRYTAEMNPYGDYYYVFSDIGPLTGDTEFVASALRGRPDATMKAKLRMHAGIDFCLYFPTSLTNSSVNLWYNDVTFPDGSTKKLASRGKETVDGVEYYVLEVTDLGVKEVLSPLSLTFGVTLRVNEESNFTNTLTFSVLDYAEKLLASDASDTDKALLLHYLSFVLAAAPENTEENALAKLSDLLRSAEAISVLNSAQILDLDRRIPTVTASESALFPTGKGVESVHLDAIGGKGLKIRLAGDFSGYVMLSYKKGGNDVITTTGSLFTDGVNGKGEDTVSLTGTRAGKITVTLLGTDKTPKEKFVFTLSDYVADAGENPVTQAYCNYLGFLYVMSK